jgi:hypothetical protein
MFVSSEMRYGRMGCRSIRWSSLAAGRAQRRLGAGYTGATEDENNSES